MHLGSMQCTFRPILSSDYDEVRKLWDGVLEMLFKRMSAKMLTIEELRHVSMEIKLLFRAIKGDGQVWASVIDLIIFFLDRDGDIHAIKQNVSYSESMLYKSIKRLEGIGFLTSKKGEGMAQEWTINKERFPVLYRAGRE